MFFSSKCYNTEFYDVSYAVARDVLGPYEKAKVPLLVSGDKGGRMKSPGGSGGECGCEEGCFSFESGEGG